MAAAPGSPRNRRNSRITARLPRYVALGVVLVALSVLAAGAAAAPAESALSSSSTATALHSHSARAGQPCGGREVRQRPHRPDR